MFPAIFSDRLKAETDAAHRDAESAPFIGALLGGELSANAVTALLAQNGFIYAALEDSAGRLPGGFHTEALSRRAQIDADLTARLGTGWRESTVPLAATAAYVRHVEQTATPEALLAHHYLRYLGDLSGGQVIRTLVGRHYGIAAEELSSYTFAEIDKPKVFKDEYRDRLNAHLSDAARQDEFIAECQIGYRMNRAIFEELASVAV